MNAVLLYIGENTAETHLELGKSIPERGCPSAKTLLCPIERKGWRNVQVEVVAAATLWSSSAESPIFGTEYNSTVSHPYASAMRTSFCLEASELL